MALRDDEAVWEEYATEFALTFGDSPTRIRAVKIAYCLGFEVDLIAHVSGFPMWRVRQAIFDGNPQPPTGRTGA